MNLTEVRERAAKIRELRADGLYIAAGDAVEKLEQDFLEHVCRAVEVKTSTKSLAAMATEIVALRKGH